MTIKILVQSLNNKTIDAVNSSDFSKIVFESNNATTLNYENWILNVHSNLNSFSLNSFWINLSNFNKDFFVALILITSITFIFLIIKFIKSQNK